jgi:hypothetical protein
MFGSKRDEMIGGWRTIHNEELYNLYSSPSKIRIIKSTRMKGSGHVVRMGKDKCIHDISGKGRRKEITRKI